MNGRCQVPGLRSQDGSSQENQRQTFLRWVKFNAVGGVGIGVQLAALVLFRSWMKFDYLLATALAVEIAVIHNFLWHERFTWETGGLRDLRIRSSGWPSSMQATERYRLPGTSG